MTSEGTSFPTPSDAGHFGFEPVPAPSSELSAAEAWYYLLAMYDALSAPTRWVWGDTDRQANEVLTNAVAGGAGDTAVPGAEPEPPDEEERPSAFADWRSESSRKPSQGRDDTEWEPRYFPDDPWDEEVARAKHARVMDASIRRKEAIGDLLAEKGEQIGAEGLLDAVSGGRFLFSPAQYATIAPWVSERIPDFPRDPDIRWQVYRMWVDAPLLADPEDAERAHEMLKGGPVFAVSPRTADELGRIMRGELGTGR